MIFNILAVAAGGALGAVLRYLLSLVPLKTVFPFQTFFTNLIGCFLIGLIASIASAAASSAIAEAAGSARNIAISPLTVLFLKTGVCGGFTTFSTFALESTKLAFESSQTSFAGAAYIVLSVSLGIGCVMLGQFLGNKIAG